MNANHWKFNAVYAVIYRILGHLWFFRLSHQAKLLEHVWAVQLKRGLHVISIAESVSWVRSSVSLICIPLSIHLSPKIGIYMCMRGCRIKSSCGLECRDVSYE
ncbi:hypothetical protein SLEP1_g35872 [Rubroshorea leprosula]|uniref:Uncharacterized protein n=1 Tax=Rubroshorea leprosula TaxID=152421 RepID=A0AAV5KQ76_9ROSI|nr:hypothetical protein SLEP1_g35872 [Rubroshorea leprosula]